MKKYKLVIDENGIPRMCKVIGVYYELIEDDPYAYTILHTISLGTLCFSTRTKKFYYINEVDMPRKLYSRFQGMLPNKERIDNLERMGIYQYDDVKILVSKWNDNVKKAETELEIEKYILDKDIEMISRRHKKLSCINEMLINGKKLEELIIGSNQKMLIDKENSVMIQDSKSKQKTI